MTNIDFFKPNNFLRPWLWFSKSLKREDLNPNPFIEFAKWYRLILRCFWLEFPDAVCLSTVDTSGKPDARMLLLKGYSTAGFVFFTNYDSAKGQQLGFNDSASMTFFWDSLQRQVRIRGKVKKISPEDSDYYFNSREKGSRISAALSKQSQVLSDPEQFKAELERQIVSADNSQITRPDNWGGYILCPDQFEFWKAGKSRAHDRFMYVKNSTGWQIDRLYP